MGYDVYCTFCGGPFIEPSIAESPRSEEFRQRVEAPRLQLKDLDGEKDGELWHASTFYDSELVSEDSTAWLCPAYGIVIEPSKREPCLVGPVEYWDYGFFDEAREAIPGYALRAYDWDGPISGDNKVLAMVPFHQSCYGLFATVKLGFPEATSQLDMKALYACVETLTPKYHKRPELDYGKPNPLLGSNGSRRDQSWQSYAGQELLVCDPALRANPEVKELIHKRLLTDTFDLLPSSVATKNINVVTKPDSNDIFQHVPENVILMIASFLPIDSFLSWLRSSSPIRAVLDNDAETWRQRLHSDMPWLAELHELLAEMPNLLDKRDVKKVYLWLDWETTAKEWMKGPFMPVANRRRVWAVCEQLVQAGTRGKEGSGALGDD